MTLSEEQAADYLNVSCAYVRNLLDTEVIPYQLVGTEHRVYFDPLAKYKAKSLKKSHKGLDELIAQAQELGLGY